MYVQIVAEIKEQIRQGNLAPGEELPSVRELGESLGINLHTVHHAYKLLRDQGVISLRLGRRAKVSALRQEIASRAEIDGVLVARLHDLTTEAFHLGLTDDDFRRLVDEVLRTPRTGGEPQ